MPQFSIIVPVYNVQNYLAACVKSVAECLSRGIGRYLAG